MVTFPPTWNPPAPPSRQDPYRDSPIYRAFVDAWARKQQKKWNCIYVLVDVHGVLMEPDYSKPSTRIYPECVNPMRKMSEDNRFRLIMWTCSKKDDIEKYLSIFQTLDIRFDWVNENPDVDLDSLGDYTSKLYANVILDDKAGFIPRYWNDVDAFLNQIT
jgi:hypothetical protein